MPATSSSFRQQSWEADLEATRNLGRYGTTTLRLYGRLYRGHGRLHPDRRDRRVRRQHRQRPRLWRRMEDHLQLRSDGLEGRQARPPRPDPGDQGRGPADGREQADLQQPDALLRHHASPRHSGQRLGLRNATSTTSSMR